MLMGNERERPGRGLVAAAITSSILYVIAAIDAASTVSSSRITSGAKTSMIGVVLMTATLFLVAVAIAISERHRAASPIPILGASLFGIFVCVLFVGSWV